MDRQALGKDITITYCLCESVEDERDASVYD